MTNPNDLIRRGVVLDRLDLAEHDAEERDWRSGANEIARLRKYVNAIPAVQPTVKPELLATTNDVAALVDVIRVQTGLIRHGCGGAQHRLNICCDRIDAALAAWEASRDR